VVKIHEHQFDKFAESIELEPIDLIIEIMNSIFLFKLKLSRSEALPNIG
jgi:hypothetical protein